MTLTKQALSEALADDSLFFGDSNYDSKREFDQREAVEIAARFTERLLPGECESCRNHHHGVGHPPDCGHADCYGTGQLWDEGLVEVVAVALHDAQSGDQPTHRFEATARAVLAALAGEVGR